MPDTVWSAGTGGDGRLHVALRDGTHALLRPVRPDDADRLRAGFDALSVRTRYQRFHGPQQTLPPKLVRYLTEVDQTDHLAWAAVLRDEPGQPGIGVARCIRDTEEPTVAECAVTVLDSWQGHGLGTLLLGVLAARARQVGIAVFRGYVLGENRPMLRLFRQLGADPEPSGSAQFRVDLQVPDGHAPLPDTPAGRVFSAVACGDLPPPDRLLPPVWVLEGR